MFCTIGVTSLVLGTVLVHGIGESRTTAQHSHRSTTLPSPLLPHTFVSHLFHPLATLRIDLGGGKKKK